MNEQTNTGLDTDWVWVIVLGVLAFGAGLPLALFTGVLRPAIDWLVDVRLLVTGPEVLLPIAAGAGLDMLRIAIVAVTLVLVIGSSIAIAMRVRAARGSRERRR